MIKMNNNLSKIMDKIAKNEMVIGTLVSFSDPVISEALCSCGFDFIVVDGEHGPLDKKDIDLHIMAIRGKGAASFVRVAWNDPILVKPILDMGPSAIIFPSIKTAAEAKIAVASCKYPPKGIRGYGPRRANDFSIISKEEYIKNSEFEPWVILIIEHIEAVNNLEEIIKVEGVDTIVIGLNDLAGSIGLLDKITHPEIIKLVDKISRICIEARLPFGIGAGNLADVKNWINKGASWIVLNSDYLYLVSGGRKFYSDVKNILKN